MYKPSFVQHVSAHTQLLANRLLSKLEQPIPSLKRQFWIWMDMSLRAVSYLGPSITRGGGIEILTWYLNQNSFIQNRPLCAPLMCQPFGTKSAGHVILHPPALNGVILLRPHSLQSILLHLESARAIKATTTRRFVKALHQIWWTIRPRTTSPGPDNIRARR